MFKKNAQYSRLDSPICRSDYAQYSAESSQDGGAQTFHFSSLAVDGTDDELVDQGYELRSRGSGAALSTLDAPSQPVEYITHDVASQDTLQTISLKYHVSVSELKRVNNIFTEKELCARRSIRVPVRRHSVLTEPATCELVSLADCEPTKPTEPADGRLSPASAASSEVRPFGDGVREGNKLLKNVDRQVTAVRAKESELRADGVLAAAGLAEDSLWPPPPAPAALCAGSGADWGLQWLCLLAAAVLLLVVVPVWYIVREYETDSLGNHHATTTAASAVL